MKRQHVHVVAESSSTPTALYRLLADSRTWSQWSDLDECAPEGLAAGEPEQVGTIRASRRGRTLGWDKVTELVPDKRLGYEHVKGLPVVDYHATVDLVPGASGTTIVWDATFAPRVPGTGWILRRGVNRFLGACAHGLADAR